MSTAARAQQTGTLNVHVTGPAGGLAGARVRAGAETAETKSDGHASLQVPAGPIKVTVEYKGMLSYEGEATAAASTETALEVRLEPAPEVNEEVVVSATRSGKRVQDEPLRVETLDR